MDILKFKLPLRICMEASSEFGDGYKDVLLSELDSSKIHGMEKLYDCQFNWLTEDGEVNEYDKKCQGFDGSEVLMMATLVDYDYILEFVTTKPLDTPVTFYKYGSCIEEDKVTMTLHDAIIFALEGQLSDGIGENELGYIRYEGEEYDVWFGDLIEL